MYSPTPGVYFQTALTPSPKTTYYLVPGTYYFGQKRKTGIPGPVFLKNGYTLKPSKKRTPRAITLLTGQIHIVPVY